MRKIGIIILSMALLAMFGGTAMAATFDVTSNYGILIPVGAECDDIGEVQIRPQAGGDEFWEAGTTITIQLLLNDYPCVTINDGQYEVYYDADANAIAPDPADFSVTQYAAEPATWAYRVFTEDHQAQQQIYVEINEEYNGVLRLFQRTGELRNLTTMCVDISDSAVYDKQDPTANRLMVSYSDNFGNTYTGDDMVATIGDAATCRITGSECSKDYPSELGFYLVEGVTPETQEGGGEPYCYPEEEGNQGDGYFGNDTCIVVDRPAGSSAFNGINDFDVTLTEDPTLDGIGPYSMRLYGWNSTTEASDNPLGEADATGAATADSITIEGVAITASDLPLRIEVDWAYDCDISEGELMASLSFAMQGASCGTDCGTLNLDVRKLADIVDYSVQSEDVTIQAIFPYAVVPGYGDWWVGMSLSNHTDQAVEVTLRAFEADGDEFVSEPFTIDPRNMKVGLFNAAAQDFIFQGDTGPTGEVAGLAYTGGKSGEVFGDERFWVMAEITGQVSDVPGSSVYDLVGFNANAYIGGFLMMGDGLQAQGYLPQVMFAPMEMEQRVTSGD